MNDKSKKKHVACLHDFGNTEYCRVCLCKIFNCCPVDKDEKDNKHKGYRLGF